MEYALHINSVQQIKKLDSWRNSIPKYSLILNKQKQTLIIVSTENAADQ